ncbi:MAG: hypothetical protein JNL11_02050 [Bdellovibrionaceae bacterium]|nr:hypothetical protein [Pseudobdellovibrionaceae bacterium]
MKIMFPRDANLFRTLWKHKLLTTRAIWLSEFESASLKTCYQRLLKLESSNHIKSVRVGDSGYAWTLSVNGYNVLKDQMPQLKIPGYGSESPLHDLIVLSASYVDSWPNLYSGLSILTDEEIKRHNLENLPEWFPFELIRRPDGIWRNANTEKLFAIEVEINLKAIAKYESIATQYQDSENITRVVWFVPSLSMAEKILSSIKTRLGTTTSKHVFFSIPNLITYGLNSYPLLEQVNRKSLGELLEITQGTLSVPGRRWCHLDISKTPYKSISSKNLFDSANPDLATYLKSTPFSNLIKIS